jgi:5-hydroxyisourate hydrolase
MSPITTHILDTGAGKPAEGVDTTLELLRDDGTWEEFAHAVTNSDGRIPDLVSKSEKFGPGVYRLNFDTGAYFRSREEETFYPYVTIVFRVSDAAQHYHVPLLLNRYGYSTYRGS